MRTLFVIGLILVCASTAGWFTINREDGETTIKINREEIRNDAKTAINKGRNYLDRHGNPQAGPSTAGQPGGEFANQPPSGNYHYPPNQAQPGQTQPVSWAGPPRNQQAGYQNQPGYQVPGYQAPNYQQPGYQQPMPNNGGYQYQPSPQQAQRPPAPWQTQPPVQQQPRY